MTKEQIVDKLILHGLVVTMDDRQTLLEDGAVAISGAEIVAIGASTDLSARFIGPTTEVIDATGQLVMPGLINAHTHASETATEVTTVTNRYGQSPLRHLDQLGLLTKRTVLAHCIHLPADEINLLAKRQTVVAHCPMSNLKLGSGIAPLPKLRQAGVQITLGTDGPVSSNDLDLWAAMRLTAVLHKGVQQDPTLLSALEVVKMVTCDTARALGLGDRVGSLAVGKQADLILIDLNRPHLTPRYDVYSHLVYAVGRDDVATVLIQGRVIMRNRQLITVAEAAVMAAVQALAQEIATA